MSESETNETRGLCRAEIKIAYHGTGFTPDKVDWILADAIDRIAADVAEIKDAAVPARAMSDVFEQLLAAANREREEAICEREGAIRAREEARAEAERLRAELAARPAAGDASDEIAELQFLVNKYRDKAEAYGGMVRGCSPALERAGHPVDGCGPDGAVGGVARAVEALVRERDEARAEAERLRAELAAARAETQRIQDEADDREQTEKVKRLNAEIEKTHRTLLNRTWERDIATAEVERLREACVLTNVLDRAGSPPVVEVPALKFLGSMTGREQGIVLAYRDALDRAGVAWREVSRE